ncbi:hypothetical protein PBY51_012614 [Eleginops maclovinus]|uniref:Uncharacterized protein n=1 Tax=Eleginops maclovinus TaxID=56733 RepID=A0AAN8ATN8_ELEMC|nr:hypothetical protein PBY51_012614 [Eleginops maclovinus]
MTLPLKHHTPTRASAGADSRPGPLTAPHFGTFICDLRRAAKNPTKPQHHPEDAQREAGARVPREWENTALRLDDTSFRASRMGSEQHAIFNTLSFYHHPGLAPQEPGHHPMRQCAGTTAESSSAYLSRSTLVLRAPSTPQRHQNCPLLLGAVGTGALTPCSRHCGAGLFSPLSGGLCALPPPPAALALLRRRQSPVVSPRAHATHVTRGGGVKNKMRTSVTNNTLVIKLKFKIILVAYHF